VEVGFVGGELPGGDLGQRIVGLEFLDDELDCGAVVVEAIDGQGPKAEVGDEGMVAVPADGEQCGLRALLLGQGLANDDNAVGPGPAMGLVLTFGDRQPWPDLGVRQARDHSFEGRGQPGDDDELPPARLDGSDHLVIVEPRIGAHPDLAHRLGQLGKAGPEQPDRPAGRVRIAGPELPMPEVLGLALEAQERMVRGAAPLVRIVADACFLLTPIQRQHRGVQVEQHPGQRLRTLAHRPEQPIVEATELEQSSGGEALEEPAQRRGIGISGQTGERLEDPISAQQLGRIETPEPQDDRIQQRQQHLRNAVGIVALGKAHAVAEVLTQSKASEEVMEQEHATKPCQVISREQDAHASGAPTVTQSALQSARKWPYTITMILAGLSCNAQDSCLR